MDHTHSRHIFGFSTGIRGRWDARGGAALTVSVGDDDAHDQDDQYYHRDDDRVEIGEHQLPQAAEIPCLLLLLDIRLIQETSLLVVVVHVFISVVRCHDG